MIISALIFIIWRSLVVFFAQLSGYWIIPQQDFTSHGLLKSPIDIYLWYFANFDGEHYLEIVRRGYGEFEYAFFPAYPMMIKLGTLILGNPVVVGLLISNISAFFLVIVIYRLFSLDFPKIDVQWGTILFLSFPTAFFLGSLYTEAFFLLLVTCSFFAARRKSYLLAGLLGIFACMTRLVGIFLLPTLLIIWWRESKKPKSFLAILLIPIGLLIILLFNWINTGDFLYFFHVQPQFGAERSGGQLVLLPQVVYRYFRIFTTVNPSSLLFFIAAQEFILTALAGLILVLARKKIRLEYLFFSWAVILVPTLTGTLSSMPRYLLAAFPLCFITAKIIRSKVWLGIIALLMIILQIINIALFVNGYWVA